MCVFVCALRLYPATPGRGVRHGWVSLGSGFGCASQLLAGVLGCVCVCVRPPPLPRHSSLGCAVWVCVLGLQLRTAIPGWGVRVCVCLCARSACTSRLLAGVRGVGVCDLAWVSAAPRHSWLGCSGVCLCVCLCAALVPRHTWLGCVVWARVLAAPAITDSGVGVCVCSCARSASTPLLLSGVWGVWVGCRLATVPVPLFVACCARFLCSRAVVAWYLSVCLGCGQRRASLACLVAYNRPLLQVLGDSITLNVVGL